MLHLYIFLLHSIFLYILLLHAIYYYASIFNISTCNQLFINFLIFSFFVLLLVNILLISFMFSIRFISFFFSNILKSLSDHSYSTLSLSFNLAISLQNSHLEQISKINSTSYSYTYILSLSSSIFILSLRFHFLLIDCITSVTQNIMYNL